MIKTFALVALAFCLAGAPALAYADDAWWDPLESTCRHASLSIL